MLRCSECANPVGEVPAPQLPGAGPRQTKSAKTSATMPGELHRSSSANTPGREFWCADFLRGFSAEQQRPDRWNIECRVGSGGASFAPAFRLPSSSHAGRRDLELDQDPTWDRNSRVAIRLSRVSSPGRRKYGHGRGRSTAGRIIRHGACGSQLRVGANLLVSCDRGHLDPRRGKNRNPV